mgnify:CR=1 FL=1
MDIIRQIIALLIPWKNETAAQKVGTVLTIIALLASFAATFFPAVPPTPAPVPSPDVIAPLDVPAVDPGAVPAPDVVPVLEVIGAAITAPLGCSSAQIAGWQAFGVGVADCLVGKCGVAADVVAGMRSGAWGEFVSDNLPCALVCLGSAVGDVIVKRGETRQVATWFGTANEVRVVEVYRVRVQRVPYN